MTQDPEVREPLYFCGGVQLDIFKSHAKGSIANTEMPQGTPCRDLPDSRN
eukprot:CAMPEP_0194769616 /NCGR_PEP_ID=MMETSP0323_2-20130528/43708_1 /TAXON_ID=2866 ORGANISM="Crypthecodinium cohnii, Strain Seligo" /NCGR_SAMPLE_ID=MMETSP0323_2 /ASSEMBLY_ACC=CAM_ASM_000346 /LENGTH=49 /DNA_ID= /DNA_START= /DNA_END= /DNA_ORIENTATION=